MRKRNSEESTNGEAWMTTYSDLMSLLLTFFVLLFAYSSVDATKFREVVESLKGALGVLTSGPALLNQNQLPSPANPIQQNMPMDRRTRISEMARQVSALLKENGIEGQVEVLEDRRGVVIRFKEAVLFDFAKADIKSESKPLLDKMAGILESLDNDVVIEGHTDNVPVRPDSPFESNWLLSCVRASRVLSYFTEVRGIRPPERFSASGYGEYRPIAPNNSEANRALNRRVDLVLLVPNEYEGSVPEEPAAAATGDSIQG